MPYVDMVSVFRLSTMSYVKQLHSLAQCFSEGVARCESWV